MNAFRSANCGDKVGTNQVATIDGNMDLRGHRRAETHECAGDDYAEILHGLNNVLASTLLNAQVMEWKLPSYSRSRRYLHEIERNAQRGGVLVKQLLERLEAQRTTSLIDGQTCRIDLTSAGDDGVADAGEQSAEVLAAELPLGPSGLCFSGSPEKRASHDGVIPALVSVSQKGTIVMQTAPQLFRHYFGIQAVWKKV